jgi:hypothetical protein
LKLPKNGPRRGSVLASSGSTTASGISNRPDAAIGGYVVVLLSMNMSKMFGGSGITRIS